LFSEAKESNLETDKFCTQFNSLLVIDGNKSKKSKAITDVGCDLLQVDEAVASKVELRK
jgi:hypothetical protein